MKIGIFFGGQSREREISFAGGRTVYDNLNKTIFEPVPIFVDSLGNFILIDWQFIYKGTIRDFYPPLTFLPPSPNGFQVYIESLQNLSRELQDEIIGSIGKKVQPEEFKGLFDFAFLALHGPFGEDGNIQGLLEWYGIPYSGSGILPSAIGVNKIIQKEYLESGHFQDVKHLVIPKKEWLTGDGGVLFKDLVKTIGLPMVIKAPNQGSSIGVNILQQNDVDLFSKLVDQSFFIKRILKNEWDRFSDEEKRNFLVSLTDIREGLGFPLIHEKEVIYHPEALWKYLNSEFSSGKSGVDLTSLNSEEEVLVEGFIKGKEFSCIVIEGEGGSIALPPTEIVKSKDLFDYRSKYLPGVIRKVTPIDLPEEAIEEIRSRCVDLFRTLHCDVYARIDGFYSTDNKIYLTDPNTTSGMMPSSFFFHQAAEIGLNPSQFLTYIIRTSLASRIKSGKDNSRMSWILDDLETKIRSLHNQSKDQIRVGVILGGYSTERHISVESGRNIYQKLSSSGKYLPLPIFLSGNNSGYELHAIPVNILLKDNADDIRDKIKNIRKSPVIERIKEEGRDLTEKYVTEPIDHPIRIDFEQLSSIIDVAFIALHGRPGEDGAIQLELEKVGIPYNGSGPESSGITIDKFGTKEILNEHGFTIASQYMVNRSEFRNDREAIFDKIENMFKYPFIAKPSDDGCSSAVKKIKNRQELIAFSELMFRNEEPLDPKLAEILNLKNNEEIPIKDFFMVEDLIEAQGADHFLEITGGLLTKRNAKNEIEYEIFEPSETLATGEVLSLEEKFLAGEGQNITPARFSTNSIEQRRISEKVRSDLNQIARILKIEGYARIDAFVRIYGDGKVETIVIEANSLPGMTPATCIFHQTALSGYKPYDFIDAILEYAMRSRKSEVEN
ncbi:MAG: D-alanine--D-alanine ligase [Bacteroidetes bacterium]|nr:D-alanine--D-alanine ligase [Bacteroidota bacterium]MDA1119652.1 D-alanine--D-alanine ligase [Bacteroidota bacterium]